MKSNPGARRGAAMLFALTALAVIGILATTLTGLILRSAAADKRAVKRVELLNAAESGIDLAISKLVGGVPALWRGARARAVPGGTCEVSVKPLGGGGYEIISRAARRGSACALRVTVQAAGGERFRVTAWHESYPP